MRRTLTAAAFLISWFTGAVMAEDKPDLSGTWVCNMDRSNFGKSPKKLQTMTLKVERKGEVFHAVQTTDDGQGPQSYEMDWFMDGKVHPVDPKATANKMTIMSRWQGNAVIAERKSNDGAFEEKMRITFSRDGKTATEIVALKAPGGNNGSKLIWEKK